MAISLLPQFCFISILSTIISITNFTYAYSQCMDDQKTLLLELKNDLIFDSSVSRKLVQWNQTEDCCSWEGVECDGAGHVISLQLDNETISGGIENSSSLFSLRYLEKLNLAYNDFNETQIPRAIHNLTYLTHLNLSNAGFGGQVPVELSLLRRLVSLDISWNSDILPLNEHLNLTMLLQKLTGLRELYLDYIDISIQGSEWCQVISSSLPDLRNLSLRYCNLSGPLDPSLLQLHSLSILQLDRNNLSTVVPDFFANFSSLTTLSLFNTNLTGSLSSMHLDGLSNLVDLNLGYNSLSGSIPFSLFGLSNLVYLNLGYNSLSGSIPLSLFGLSNLVYLNLGANSLSGSIPLSLFGLSSLVYLNLRYNLLSGSIPLSLFGLPSLQRLVLSNNQFCGQVHEFPTRNFSHMTHLYLSDNRLEGPIPESFFKLESLEILSLSYNLFNGTFQLEKIKRLRNLTSLDLSDNNLTVDASNINSSSYGFPQLYWLALASCNLHNFPDLRNQSYLYYLDLSNNRIAGEIPSWIWEIGNGSLRYLGLSYNNLTVDASNINSSSYGFPQLEWLALASCNLHNFPDLRNQSYLYSLDLSNNRIAGEIPSWIWEIGNGSLGYLNLSCNLLVDLQKPYHMPTSLSYVDLHSNQLWGELPLLPQQARYVDYSNNNFDKSIPLNINGNTSNLFFFSLANNSLSGAIPTSLCNSSYLRVLDLSFNNLSGNIPPCLLENIENLEVLNLRRNNINGDIPDKFSVNCSLKTLDLSNNNLGGQIPESLGNCKSLRVMNVGNNDIDDSFPCMLSSSLRVLVLRSNRLHGEVTCHESWPNLQIIDIASNKFSGNLHRINFSSWRGMMLESDTQLRRNHSGSNFLSPNNYYRDEVTLTIKGLELKLVKIWADFTSIDFSCNNFRGEIPDVIGDLSSLYLLNLSHNTLIGTIPKSIGDLRQLGSLDLSMNKLTGTIPMELVGLTFLSVLNLSYNKLVGMIPIGRQLQTFSVDSFEGNTGLCGFPLNISCGNTDENDLSPPKLENVQPHRKMEIEWDYVSAALGYVVGLGSFLWLVWSCQSLRQKYFEKVDQVLEKIFDRQDRKRKRVLRNRVRRQKC